MTKFQIFLLVFFGLAIVVGVASFAFYRGGSGNSNTPIIVWGDIPAYDFNLLFNTPSFTQDRTLTITYEEKPTETIEKDFTEALAEGVGPDLIILSQDKFLKNKSKLLSIPYSNISERDFKTTFIEEGEIFLDQTGIYALPLIVDPLVLYYNRDILSSAGYAQPILYWDEIYASATNLSKRDAAGNLISSVIALGEAGNIPNYKNILSLLLLQAGSPITGFAGTELRSQVSYKFNLPVSPGESALDFYTQFSNPTKTYYSWNRSLIDAQTHFTAGDSAYYIGFASEFRTLKNKNPTLNFAVSSVPQSRVSGKAVTYGLLSGVAISRGTKNPSAALAAAKKLISGEVSASLSEILFLPPTRRDLLSVRPTDPAMSVFYDAALQSKGWLDPDAVATAIIFRQAIESVTSGRARTLEALSKIDSEIDALIR